MQIFYSPFAIVVPDFASASEVSWWLDRANTLAYEASAPITTAAGFTHRPDIRNNARAITDREDWASLLWPATKVVLPPVDGFEAVGLNKRFRFYRYGPGQRFAPHFDGAYVRPDGSERSLLTWILYLEADCDGGATRLHHHGHDVQPVPGTLLVFEHRQRHEGCEVTRGRKTVLRTDVMYRAV